MFNISRIFHFLKLSLLMCAFISGQSASQISDISDTSPAHLDKLFKQQKFKDVVTSIKQMPTQSLSEEHYRFLIYSLADKDLDDAEHAAQQAIEQFPNSPDVYLMHASIMGQQASDSLLSALSYAKKARISLETAVSLAPDELKYHIALLSFHLNAPSIAGGDKVQALEQVQIIKGLDAIAGATNLAWYYQVMERPEDALALLKQANQDYPQNIDILNSLANLAISRQEYAQAILYYQGITELNLEPPVEDLKILEEYEEALYRQLNAHYQIGRAALVGKTNLTEGLMHLQNYINHRQNPKFIGSLDTSGLPSVEWAKLRMSALLLADNQKQQAQTLFATITLDKVSDNMQNIHSKLKKELK